MSEEIVFHTETGSIYRLTPTTATRMRVLSGELRRDGEELRLLGRTEIAVGHPVMMWLDLRQDGVVTRRMTSNVTKVVTS